MKKIKICFVASSGGHLEEISQLKRIEKNYDNFIITEKICNSDTSFGKSVYYVPQINRKELLFLIKFIYLFVIAFKILKKEKPDLIITTGALCSYPICVVAKILFKIKIIYIESFARVDSLSLTGKLLKNFVDLYIVQWEELLIANKNAIYGGTIF